MRIALTASLVLPVREAQTGGATAFICDLAAALAERGHEVTVYCAEGSSLAGLRLVQVPVDPAVSAARVRPAGSPAAPAAAVPALREAFARQLEAVREDEPDALSQHAFDAEAIELAEGLPAEGLPVLHTLHLPPLVPAVVAAARSSAAPFVTVSEACAGAWREAGLGSVGVIRNGVPSFEVPEPAGPAGVAGGDGAEQVALVAGRISPEKGTATALRAAAALGLRPQVVGPVYDRDYWAREVRLPAWAVERRHLWRLMARSAVTLMPVQWDEPFGLVAAESQVAGCPVAGYRRGGLPEAVEEGVGGHLAAPGDFEGLLAAARACLRLDRAAVRAAALRRLLIGPVAEAYERELAALRR
jgi:glycosyltransferase involved in cell wall biosynthesis